MRHLTRVGARIGAVLVAVAVTAVALGSPAQADVPGFQVKVGQAPATFTIGKNAKSLTAVVSTDRQGRRCFKVRWALTVETKGISLDQVRVTRVESGKAFAVRAGSRGDAATLVDERPDPGELCRDRTVTGRWDIAFTGPDDGEVTFGVQALDGTGRVLSSSGAQARVVSPVAARPSKSPSATPKPVPTEDAPDEAAVADQPTEPASSADAAALNPASSSSNVLGIGLIVGALMVFLGVGMLLRLRSRNRRGAAIRSETQAMPTGFYSMPDRRRR
ncbi:hypothetical protein [Actinoplanes solisilvae]|uniref:hypothetical protein n=1 Tax=Actinoplanes solisilvae TaxID=2486853 RepID=UPI000FDA96DB|nr:hypothetical protein [Actinoplanes solisilvae]